ncbi:MAG: response regulator [Myxococcales bacterium]|nr:response regulator [Myxococcales bacterium]
MGRILLVDDDGDYCETVQAVFTQLGFEVSYLLSADDALGFAERYQPNLAILDLHIGAGLTGDELARLLRTDPATSHIRIVLVSSCPDAEERALAAGVDAFLSKPFEMAKLIEIVGSLTKGLDPMATGLGGVQNDVA